MGCFKCANLDTKNKKAGKISGSLYYCKKLKKYVNPKDDKCQMYKKADRTDYQNQLIYLDGKRYQNGSTNMWPFIILFLILALIGLLSGVFI